MKIEKGKVSAIDNVLEINIPGGFKDNCKYTIKLKNIKDKKGNSITEDIVFYTKLSPLFSDIEAVKSLIGDIEVPDSKILYQIREASRYSLYLYDEDAEPFTEDNIPFEVSQFVKYRAAYESLLVYAIKETSQVGTSGKVGDVSFSDKETNRDVKTLLNTFQTELSKWRDAVKGYGNEGRAKMQSAVKGRRKTQFYAPGYLSPKIDNFDRSIHSGGKNDVLR